MRDFLRNRIEETGVQSAVAIAALSKPPAAAAAKPALSLVPKPVEPEPAPKPVPKPTDKLAPEYKELSKRFADPEGFLERLVEHEKGVKRLADMIIANPELTKDVTEDRFEALLTVRNNVVDAPDPKAFLSWASDLRDNELEFVGKMGNMTSSRMKSFTRNARLVFGGPAALNPSSPELVRIAMATLRYQPEGTANRTAFAFAKEMSVATVSPKHRARAYVDFCSGMRKKKDVEDLRDEIFKDREVDLDDPKKEKENAFSIEI